MNVAGSNAANQPGEHVILDADVEMNARDSFGPLVRDLLDTAPLMASAGRLLSDVLAGGLTVEDLRNPKLDKALAIGIRGEFRKLLALDTDEWRVEQGMKALVPRRIIRERTRGFRCR